MTQMIQPSRTSLVTGASRGIGRAIAVALGARRFNVIVNYLSNVDAANETVALVARAGGKGLAVQADVGSGDDRARLVHDSLVAFGSIDVLVNNAGIPPSTRDDLLEADEADYDRVMNTNLKGPFFLTQLVAGEMVRRGVGLESEGMGREAVGLGGESQPANPKSQARSLPCIVNIGSISAYAASETRGPYCIAKAGLAMMTRLFAARLAREGIHVYEVRPGIIDTDMARGAKAKYDRLISEGGLLPIARWGTPDDVAKAVGAIVDGALPYSTGAVIDVDGGFSVRRL